MDFSVLEVDDFLLKANERGFVVVDARSESEFAHAHFPGSINIPILNDEERKLVGTCYKEKGKQPAVLLGFELVGPRFHQIITDASIKIGGQQILMYCWRGGMRSNILAWLLSMYGYQVTLLRGGYKAYRNWVLEVNSLKRNFLVLGGATGSGKTEVLSHLISNREPVLDLESLANHKGSAFGSLGQGPQPSTEHFENLLAHFLTRYPLDTCIWIENESRTIGRCVVPESIYNQIRISPVIELVVPLTVRKNRIEREYGRFSIDQLTEKSEKIKKRMGPQNLKAALDALHNGSFDGWLSIVLEYYDRQYTYGNEIRKTGSITKVQTDLADIDGLIQQLIQIKSLNLLHKNE
jgi:tRNA 2-selenouridine synthase